MSDKYEHLVGKSVTDFEVGDVVLNLEDINILDIDDMLFDDQDFPYMVKTFVDGGVEDLPLIAMMDVLLDTGVADHDLFEANERLYVLMVSEKMILAGCHFDCGRSCGVRLYIVYDKPQS